VQGTANGYGERCGNADLFSIVAGLELKLGRAGAAPRAAPGAGPGQPRDREVANIAPDPHAPYVGLSAFAHKAGLHVSAIKVAPEMYQHVDPLTVGNDMRLLVSELAGRATIVLKGKEMGLDLDGQPETVLRVIERVKDLESVGYTFEAADASFELLLRGEMGDHTRFFELESWRTIVERRPGGELVSEATVKLTAKGERIVATGEGNGPVNALDKALRVALEQLYPSLASLELVDFKVRIVEGGGGTGAVTRVLVETSTGRPSGTRSASTRTSSRRRGRHSTTRSRTACCARARSRPEPAWTGSLTGPGPSTKDSARSCASPGSARTVTSPSPSSRVTSWRCWTATRSAR
jgi:2-isopropylmalate synthase